MNPYTHFSAVKRGTARKPKTPNQIARTSSGSTERNTSNCFGPTKKRTSLRRLRKSKRRGQQLSLRLVGPGQRHRLEFDSGVPWIDGGGEEIVIVDSCEPEWPLVCGLLGDAGRGNAFDVAVLVINRLRRLDIVSREETAAAGPRPCVAQARAPCNRGIERTIAAHHARREHHDVVLRVEAEVLLDAQSCSVLILEGQRGRLLRRVGAAAHITGDPVRAPSSDGASDSAIVNDQSKWLRLIRRNAGRHQIHECAGTVAVVLQAPVQDCGRRDCSRPPRVVRGLNDDLALG